MTSLETLPRVSVVFVSFNRAHTLVATYETFLAYTDYPRDRLELVLADDCSDEHTQSILDQMTFDVRAVATRNAGLGANQNRGMRAATGDLIMMLQDDWLMVGDPHYLRKAVAVLGEAPDLGMILFRDRDELPDREVRTVGSETVRVLGHLSQEGARWNVGASAYSDNPHLKRVDFHQVVGDYLENVRMTDMEIAMSKAVQNQSVYKVATIDGLSVFRHIGESFSFNPCVLRARKMERIQRVPGMRMLWDAARSVRDRLFAARTRD